MKIAYKALIFALLTGMISISCDDDDSGTGNLRMTFIGSWDGSPLVMNSTQDYSGGQKIKINVSEFFLSELALESGGESVALSDIAEVNFTDQNLSEAEAAEGVEFFFGGIPAGNYDAISMGVGVSPDLNAQSPADFASDHPLSVESAYWDAWDSYIFSKLEGRLDTTGMEAFDLIYIYHSGKNELYQKHSLDFDLSISSGGTTEILVMLDHRDLLYEGGVALDIQAKPTAHSAGDLQYPQFILGNFPDAITIEQQ